MESWGCRSRIGAGAWPRLTLLLTAGAVSVALLSVLCTPAPALGSQTPARGLTLGFAEPRYSSHDAMERSFWFDRGVQAGGEWARISLSWRAVAKRRPRNPSAPASPEYRFGGPDAAVREAAGRGQPIVLTISRAPGWAEGPRRPGTAVAPSGTWRPDSRELALFAKAVAARYSGAFPDPKRPGRKLPKVSRFEIWNEPNLAANLTPQRERGQPVAAAHYRRMVNGAYSAIHSVQPGALVAVGSLASIGSARPGGIRSVGPLLFLRRLLCVAGGAGTRKLGMPCGQRVLLDVLSHHPINIRSSPREPAGLDDAGILEMTEITEILRAAEAAGTVPGGRHPVWATEFWWYSNTPRPNYRAEALARQARYIAEGLYLLWLQGVKVAIMYQLGDEPGNPFQTGIYYADGRPKPAETAFRFPLVGDRQSRREVRVWGRAPRSGVLRIAASPTDGRWRTRKAFNVARGEIFRKRIRLRGSGSIRATIKLPGAERERSLIWQQGGGVDEPRALGGWAAGGR